MKAFDPRTWGVTARLVMVATVPPFIMFAALTAWLYWAATAEIAKELDERAGIIAAALAEASPYGLASGNTDYLERAMRGLQQRDRAVAAIDVLDNARQVVVAVGRREEAAAGQGAVEVAVRSELPDVDTFDQQGPHISLPGTPRLEFKPGPIVGYVRVTMSAEPVQAARRDRLLGSALIVALSTLASVLAGLGLAQRLRAPLRSAMQALRLIRRGDYDIELDLGSSHELRDLQQAILAMAVSLRASRRELEARVETRTQELEAAVAQLRFADAERRRLISRGNTLIEEERQRIAREIHDHLNAELIAVRLQAQNIAATVAPGLDEVAVREIERAAERIGASTASLYDAARRIVKQLRPEILDMLGLPGALEEMTRQFDELHPACRFAFKADNDLPDLRGPLAITGYRLVQEALSNLVKHAGASHAQVNLRRSADRSGLVIEVIDDGCGFYPTAAMHAGTGIIGMRERVSTSGGRMVIDTHPAGGTTVRFELPLPETG